MSLVLIGPQGQPHIADLALLNERWKSFLERRFDMEFEGNIANPEYRYVKADGDDSENLQLLAFWIRYDHRIEAGGAWFPLMANDEEAARVLRMTTRQRYTRGYGCLADRNLKKFDQEVEGMPLMEALLRMPDENLSVIEGQWEVLTLDMLRDKVPFVRASKDFESSEAFDRDSLTEVPLDIENCNSRPVLVKFSGLNMEGSIIGSGTDVVYFHRDLHIWSFWRRVQDKNCINFSFAGATGKIPLAAHQQANGLFIWKRFAENALSDKVIDLVN